MNLYHIVCKSAMRQEDTFQGDHQAQMSLNWFISFQLYRPLDIYVALVGVEVWTSGDRIRVTNDADETMKNFLNYRKQHICPNYRNDNAQLIT